MCRGAEDERSVMSERAGMLPTAESEELSDKLQRAGACLPASDLSSYSCTLNEISVYLCNHAPRGRGGGRPSCLRGLAPCDEGAKGRGRTGARTGGGWGRGQFGYFLLLCLFICVIQSPPRAGRGAAELSERSRPMRRRSKGARTNRREDGGRVGERTIWIFLSSYPCSFILSAMVQYSVSNNTKRSHTDHLRCSVMLFSYSLFDMLLNVFSYILIYSICYFLFVLQSAFTQIW